MTPAKSRKSKLVIDSRLATKGLDFDAGEQCTISLAIGPDDGQPNFHRAAQLETGQYLAFDGDTASAIVPPGPHALTWYASGNIGEHFAWSLTGEVDKNRKDGARIPPSRSTFGIIDFVAKR
jgi:hypothetical protein